MKVGDRVKVLKSDTDGLVGMEGTIAVIDNDLIHGVAFPGYDGHGCRGHTPENNGRWVPESWLSLLSESASMHPPIFTLEEITEALS